VTTSLTLPARPDFRKYPPSVIRTCLHGGREPTGTSWVSILPSAYFRSTAIVIFRNWQTGVVLHEIRHVLQVETPTNGTAGALAATPTAAIRRVRGGGVAYVCFAAVGPRINTCSAVANRAARRSSASASAAACASQAAAPDAINARGVPTTCKPVTPAELCQSAYDARPCAD
jgi:hypothetical protein